MSLYAGLTTIAGLKLTCLLGRGAFGEVWEAARGAERLALKLLDCRQRPASEVSAEVRVLRTLSGLKHPHIIQLHEVHAWERYVVLVMERADGSLEDLRQAYQEASGENIPPRHALDLLDQAACALDFIASARPSGPLSARGLQHCDVKPSNLLLVGNTLKVADFGLCVGTGAHTHKQGWRGTPPFAAPELYGGCPSPGTDQFALAVTFCALVMGQRPFLQGDLATSPPQGIPIDLTKLRTHEAPVFSRALHRFPSSRYSSCREFLQELRKVAEAPRPATRIFPRGLTGTLRQMQARRQSESMTTR
jgi:serine/threonine-protein kinase